MYMIVDWLIISVAQIMPKMDEESKRKQDFSGSLTMSLKVDG